MAAPSKPWLQGFSLPAQEKRLPNNEDNQRVINKLIKEPTEKKQKKGNKRKRFLITF